MSKQLLLCVETSKRARTDSIYIDETIERFYILGNDIRKRYIYLNGKSNYNKPRTVKEIERQSKQYESIGPTTVLYCIDTDKCATDPIHAKEFEAILKYCQDKNYELVWFCRDVEDVFWGEQVHNDEKKSRAAQFRSSKAINKLTETTLSRKTQAHHYSNILLVLDKYLERR